MTEITHEEMMEWIQHIAELFELEYGSEAVQIVDKPMPHLAITHDGRFAKLYCRGTARGVVWRAVTQDGPYESQSMDSASDHVRNSLQPYMY